MNNVERVLLERMENEKFQKVMDDNFAFADSLIDMKDLEKLNNEEAE